MKDKNKSIQLRWHLITELAVSVSQTAIFFFLALFSSNFLRDKQTLTEFVNQKINKATFPEFWLTILSIVVVSGVMFILLQASRGNQRVNAIAKHVLLEMPRTISIFGSSILAVFVAIAIHLHYYPEANASSPFAKFMLIGILFWAVAFIYSVAIKWMLDPPNLTIQK